MATETRRSPLEEPDVPPSYESLGHPLHCHNPGFERGEEGEELPPPYSPTVRTTSNVLDAPPDYYSLFGQIREARLESSNNLTFLRKACQIILNTVGCTILLVVFMSVPITILVLGAIFVNDCPLNPRIPVFLIVGGISGILKNLSLIVESVARRCRHRLPGPSKETKYATYIWKFTNLLFNLFMLAWIITGSYWIYGDYDEVNDDHFETCNELLYKFAFGILTSSFILLVLMFCCTCCCGFCLKRNTGDREREEEEEEEEGEEEREGEEREGEREGENQSGDDDHESEVERRSVEEGDEESFHSESEYGTNDGQRLNHGVVNHQDYENTHHVVRLNNGALVQVPANSRPPVASHGITRGDASLEHFQMSEYADSPILSPSHRPHTRPPPVSSPSHRPHARLPPVSSPSHSPQLYFTESPQGFSCTSV